MANDTDETTSTTRTRGSRRRWILAIQVTVGLIVVGVTFGVVLGWAGASLLTAGLGGSSDDEPTNAAPPAGGDETDEPDPEPEPTDPETTEPEADEGTLEMPSTAAAGSEITISGTLPGSLPGTVLQIQRFENGSWTDFPVDVTVGEGGAFSTFVVTTQTGEARWRLINLATGRTTPVVTVTVT